MNPNELQPNWMSAIAAIPGPIVVGIALSLILMLTVQISLMSYAARTFRSALSTKRAGLAILATWSATFVAAVVVVPLVFRMASGSNAIIYNLVTTIILFALPLGAMIICVDLVERLRQNEAAALALFTFGAYMALGALLSLIVSAIVQGDIQLLSYIPYVGQAYEYFKNMSWLSLALGAALAFLGYNMGTKLPAVKTGGTVLPPEPLRPSAPPSVAPASGRWLSFNGQQVPLAVEGEHHIGRSSECAVRVTGDDEISRQHALLRLQQDRVVLQDGSSRNGTYLNEVRLAQPRELQDGDQIRVGNTTIVFHNR